MCDGIALGIWWSFFFYFCLKVWVLLDGVSLQRKVLDVYYTIYQFELKYRYIFVLSIDFFLSFRFCYEPILIEMLCLKKYGKWFFAENEEMFRENLSKFTLP